MNRFINSKFSIWLVILAGLILRSVSLNQSLWLDEATSALVAKMSLWDIFTKFLPGDFHPPLYYLILKYWSTVFGYSEMSLRAPSIIFGLVTVYFAYLIGKKLFSQNVGIFAGVLLATSGLHDYYSQEARMYSLASMLVAISLYLFICKKWILFGITLAFIGLTDYISLFIIPVFWILSGKDWKKMALSHFPLVVVFVAWFPIFFKQISSGLMQKGSAWWNILGTITVKNIALIPVKFIIGRVSLDNKLLYGAFVGLLFLLFGYLMYRARKATKVVWFWLLIPVALGILISFKVPTLTYFRFLFCLPALYLLIAYGVENHKKFKYPILAILVVINLLTTGYYLFNPKFQREDWRSAAKAVGSDPIVFPGGSQTEALVYYGKSSQIESVFDITVSQKELWLSRYVWEIVDPKDLVRAKIESLGYNKTAEYDFNGVVFWRYNKNLYANRN